MVKSSTILTIPPRRHDLINDYGWKVRVDTDEGSTYFRFGSRTLFGEYFKNGRTTYFGSMPNTGIIFPSAAECIIKFIQYCAKVMKQWKATQKRKQIEEETLQSQKFKVLKTMR
jgi:hypothetical protein